MVGVGLGVMAVGGLTLPVRADTASTDQEAYRRNFQKIIPAAKTLDPEWVKSLTTRGTREIYRNPDLQYIGMPVGGLCCGQLYLGGDGKLWLWDIFNHPTPNSSFGHYVSPMLQQSPIEQGFAIRVGSGKTAQTRRLDKTGFKNISFCGEYPMGFVTYSDPDFPLTVSLEVFSPFIPLNVADSSLPATVVRYTIRNDGTDKTDVEVMGWLENKVCIQSQGYILGYRRNRISRTSWGTTLTCSSVRENPGMAHTEVYENFSGKTWGKWKAKGTAFGPGPVDGSFYAQKQGLSGFSTHRVANSFVGGDAPQGSLTSPQFKITKRFISFLIGGGCYGQGTCINLVVNGKVERTATGENSDIMNWCNWDVKPLIGRTAYLEVIDHVSGPWGHIEIAEIEFRDSPAKPEGWALDDDFGTMTLTVMNPQTDDPACAMISDGPWPNAAFVDRRKATTTARKKFPYSLLGSVGRRITLRPGEQATVSFCIGWHFPHLHLPDFKTQDIGRHYAARFNNSEQVVSYVARNIDRLYAQTRLWHDTWYDSTLPYWFLNRSFLTMCNAATSTAYRFANGRFWAYEGVSCCPGTCTHVWSYAQAMARLFPELERLCRKINDYEIGYNTKTGNPNTAIIGFRAEFDMWLAVDGQAGTILRTLREHQMSPDHAFLKSLWPRVKKALNYLVAIERA